MKSTILVATPDDERAAVLTEGLPEGGFVVVRADASSDVLEMASTGDFAAIVLDTALAEPGACSICASLRSARDTTPVLMLTPPECVHERIAGLECGADDCLQQPFELEELMARLRALIRRDRVVRAAKVAVGDLTVDSAARVAMRGGREIRLTQREFTLLEALAVNAGKVVSRAVIQAEVWGDGFSSSNTVDVHIRNLRKKVDDDEPVKLIHTVFGMGYMLRPPNDEQTRTPARSDDPPGPGA